MFVDIRIASAYRRESGRPIAANADTVARAMSRRVRKLFEEYVAIGVAIGFLGFAIVLELTKGAGDLGAQVFDVLAEAPIISAALGSDLLAYKALGGPLPVVDDLPLIGAVLGWLAGNIDYVGFAALAGFILLIAVLSKRNK
ncbi:MAG: hypothetical protein U5J98_06965 [Halobacteriales archaeon]|nr:hypothetical protein [Halobacteriales archaeon]